MVRKMTRTSAAGQLNLYESDTPEEQPQISNTRSTFADNLSPPVHRWFRYSAGVFTEGVLTQLKSLGFSVVCIPFDEVVDAFKQVGVDAFFDEDTEDAAFAKKVRAWDALASEQRGRVSDALIAFSSPQVAAFFQRLKAVIDRRITRIRITLLHGSPVKWPTIDEAIAFINGYNETADHGPLVKYEVEVLYSNGDRINGVFAAKKHAIKFLQLYKSP